MSQLPSGLKQAVVALVGVTDALERLITLAHLRQLVDATMPTVAGHNHHALLRELGESLSWRQVMLDTEHRALRLDAIAALLNMDIGQPLLTGGWMDLEPEVVERALDGITRWRPSPACGGDVLGELLQLVRPPGGGAGQNAYYTPWHVCRLMACLLELDHDDVLSDPCCGSGRLLLAGIELYRERYGAHTTPTVYASDIDPLAVRVCSLNMLLAGVRAHVCLADALADPLTECLSLPMPAPTTSPAPRVQRNQPCPCGSGLKSKRCCHAG